MNNKFLTFINPYLSFIDNGHLFRKPFSILYAILGILNLIIPIAVLFMAIANNIFRYSGIFGFLLIWIVIAFAGWCSFQLWWNRKSKLKEIANEGDEFVATPVFSHLIQTIGEWLGTWIGLVGFGSGLITALGIGGRDEVTVQIIGAFQGLGWVSIFIMPIFGFLIILLARFLAEQFRALTSIANNTNKH